MADSEKMTFLVASPADATGTQVVIHASASLVERSSVLNIITSTEGPAHLPENISEPEYRVWAQFDPYDVASTVPTSDLITALRVADVLDDTLTGELAKALASRLRAADWTNDSDEDTMRRIVHHLSFNLQSVLFTAMCSDVVEFMSTSANWPTWAQRAGLSAFLAFTDSLRLGYVGGKPAFDPKTFTKLLSLLSSTRLHSPGLSSLKCSISLPSAKAARHLAGALAHHTTLSSLTLDTVVPIRSGRFISNVSLHGATSPTAALCTVLSTIPQLSALTHLSIEVDTPDPQSADTPLLITALARAVAGPPRLASLSLIFGDEKRRTQRRTSAPSAPATMDPLFHAFSAAPKLTALEFYAITCTLPFRAMDRPYPSLQSFRISPILIPYVAGTRAHPPTSFRVTLPPVPAPATLTHLMLDDHCCLCRSPSVLSAFLTSLRAATALQQLHLDQVSVASQGFGKAFKRLAGLQQLTALTALTLIIFHSDAAPECLPHVLTSLAQLTQLAALDFEVMFVEDDATWRDRDMSDVVGKAPLLRTYVDEDDTWNSGLLEKVCSAMVGLSTLTRLQCMRMCLFVPSLDELARPQLATAVTNLLVASQEPWGHTLTRLTLSLTPLQKADNIWGRIAPMHALQDLDIGPVEVSSQRLQGLARSMPALTRLALSMCPLNAASVRCYAVFAARASTLAVSKISKHVRTPLDGSGRHVLDVRAYLQALTELPRRGTYLLPDLVQLTSMRRSVAADVVQQVAEVVRMLQGQGADVDDRITRIAY